jgi:hypothetical protein
MTFSDALKVLTVGAVLVVAAATFFVLGTQGISPL